MQAITKKVGSIIIPFGWRVLDYLNQSQIEILWDEEQVKNTLETMSFHGEENSPPIVLNVSVDIPIEIDDEWLQAPVQPQRVPRRLFNAPVRAQEVPANDPIGDVLVAPARF